MELQRVKIHCMTKSNWRPPRLPWSIPSHPSAHLTTLLSCWSISSVYFKSPVTGTLYFPCLTHRISSWWGSLEDMWQATGVIFLDKSRFSPTSGPGPSLPRVSILLPSFSLIVFITIDIIVLFIWFFFHIYYLLYPVQQHLALWNVHLSVPTVISSKPRIIPGTNRLSPRQLILIWILFLFFLKQYP